jgi:hypothetical protein
MFAAVLALAMAAAPLAAQQRADGAQVTATGVLSLLVTDEGTDAPLPDVTISMPGIDRQWMTDALGRFVLVAPARRIVLTLRRIGYEPGALEAELTAGDTTRLAFNLTRLTGVAQMIDTMLVRAAGVPANTPSILRGFEERRATHPGGRFLTRADIERTNSIRMTGVLQRVLGVKIIDSLGRKYAASSRGEKANLVHQTSSACVLRVMVDGLMMPHPYPVDDIDVNEVYGVEVYPGPSTIPAEFVGGTHDGWCGLIMLWRKMEH